MLSREDRDPLSAQLRSVRDLVLRRQHSNALGVLNGLLAGQTSADAIGQILGFVGDVQFARGKFDDAVTAYKTAQNYVAGSAELWFRPVFGEISGLLKNVQLAPAKQQALQAITNAQAKEDAWRTLSQAAQATVASGKPVQIPPRPLRTSVVATRLGKLFLNEGEIEAAKFLLGQALQVNPNGACKARLGLAEVALQESQPAVAAEMARSAIVKGSYRAKTIPGWGLLVTARVQQGLPGLDASTLNGLAQASPSIRARTIVAVATALRSVADVGWKSIALNWLNREGSLFPSASAALRLMMVAEARRSIETAPAEVKAAATALAEIPGISPTEWVISAKQLLKTTDPSTLAATASFLLAQGVARYGPSSTTKILYALCPVIIASKQRTLAKTFLQQIVASTHMNRHWRQCVVMLARAEARDGNYGIAANYYLLTAQNPQTPLRCQFVDRVKWAKCLVKTGQIDAILQAKDQLLEVINANGDYRSMLELAHVLIEAPSELNDLASTLMNNGTALAMQALSVAATPATAASILMYLARRQADFGQYTAIIAGWAGLSDPVKNWMWSANSDYWEYICWVFRAYRDSGDPATALNFAEQFLTDSATPLPAVAMLSSLKGVQLMLTRNQNAGMAALQRAIAARPTCKYCAYGYYWQALYAYRGNSQDDANSFANRIVAAIGNNPIMHWEHNLMMAAACLLANLDASSVKGKYSNRQIVNQINNILIDMNSLS